ncbi:holin [Actinoplanes aureus]|uniref:Holin n=1 Tax=Actinoplanes aureus TaxID=2792083 RepID=A0A931C9C6_9ACTN|nr:holin [Actinoplanes aureus]MBG0560740.1 holin [Actinoplanes aureus]
MRTRVFWTQTAERAVKTAAQALLGLWPLDQFNILDADPRLAGGIAAGAAVLSILTSLASTAVGDKNSPSATV